jgi:hypothetical protein
MKEVILFEVKQYFGTENVRKFLFLVCATFLLGAMIRWLIIDTLDDNLITTFFGLFLLSLVIVIILSFCLTTQITADGLVLNYFPFFSGKKIYWSEIQELFIREYNPLAEYGGWGIKFGPSGSVYNVRGNTGLQIIFHDGSRLLIGTGQPNAINKVLQKLGKNK